MDPMHLFESSNFSDGPAAPNLIIDEKISAIGVAGTVYLACDDEPVTREEICAAALASGLFPGLSMPKVR